MAAPARLLSASGNTSEQQDQGVVKGDLKIKVDVDLVPVDVTVYGTPVRDLRAEDFVVYDNNVAQRLIHFSRDQLPLAVALVVDTSGSLTAYLPELRSAALSALGSLKPEDQTVLFGFSAFPARLSELTQNRSQIIQKLAVFSAMGNTNIWDAIFVAAHCLRANAIARRRAIILISDNGQVINWGQTWESALQEALLAGATLYAIETRGSGSLYAESDSVRRIAADTGGEFFSVGARGSLSTALDQSIAYFRQQYTLGFSPSAAKKDGAFHSLSVKLTTPGVCPDCRLHARKGYYAGIPSVPNRAPRRAIPGGARVEPHVYNEITVAAADISDRKEILFEIKTDAAEGILGRLLTRVDLLIDPARIQFKNVNGLQTASLCICVFLALSDGVFFSTEWKTLDVRLKEDAYQQVMKSGIVFSTQVRGAPEMLRVVVYDLQSDQLGTKWVKPRLDRGSSQQQ
jgi:Ca-activated chloride channel family protein